MKKCAYCETPCNPTKEHIYPKTIIAKSEEKLLTYNIRTKQFHEGEAVIKDVCQKCNNKKLSTLDAYLGKLYDLHFGTMIMPGNETSFTYKYDLLLRGILKIAYNSSRAHKLQGENVILAKLRKYILDGTNRPQAIIKLQIVTAAKIIENRKKEKLIEPWGLRNGTVPFDGQHSSKFLVRMVGFNCFYFYVAIPKKPEPKSVIKEFSRSFSNWRTPTGIEITRSKVGFKIPVNKTTYYHEIFLPDIPQKAFDERKKS